MTTKHLISILIKRICEEPKQHLKALREASPLDPEVIKKFQVYMAIAMARLIHGKKENKIHMGSGGK